MTPPTHPEKRKRATAEDEEGDNFPTRDCDRLYCQTMTVDCAQLHCIPCAYKIGCFDISLDKEFTRCVPNQRPEQCPRAKSPSTAVEGTLGYHSGMSVLTVGDGDLSFSLAIARILSTGERGAERLVATSYESRATLERVYPSFPDTLAELDEFVAQVAYQVDATQIRETLPTSIAHRQFHRIVWNFPCTAVNLGQDGQNDVMEENKELVRRFIRCASQLLHSNGEIHMLHKTKPPYNQWKLESVAVESCKGMMYCGRVVLDRFALTPYTPRKALDRKSFPCHDACTFIFKRSKKAANAKSDETGPSFPSTIPSDIGLSNSTIVPITVNMISKVRKNHLQKGKSTERDTRTTGRRKTVRR